MFRLNRRGKWLPTICRFGDGLVQMRLGGSGRTQINQMVSRQHGRQRWRTPGSLPPFLYRSAPACAYLTTADAFVPRLPSELRRASPASSDSLGLGSGTVQPHRKRASMKRSTAFFCVGREVGCAAGPPVGRAREIQKFIKPSSPEICSEIVSGGGGCWRGSGMAYFWVTSFRKKFIGSRGEIDGVERCKTAIQSNNVEADDLGYTN